MSNKFLISILVLICFITLASVSAADNSSQNSLSSDSSTTDANTPSLENMLNANNGNENSQSTNGFSMDNMAGMNMSDMMSGMNMSYMIPGMNPSASNDTTPETSSNNNDQQGNTQPVSHTQKQKEVKQNPTKTTNNQQKVYKTHTIKKASDNSIVYQGNSLTLDAINKIFGQNITNGHLVVFMDGQVIFNDTVSDDLSMTILQLIEKYLGNHKIKIEFTDANNNTNTYEEDIIIE
ncbi:MAG: hypothetical protein VZQ62_05770 [Methanosphaera sp.]|uniref:hypothetical protein n=1 Tax=Methanosphaera sp. TaxID=2666342 RepID=UPI002E796794|nr:hypothetical protein [Methanosphaera sp.]MEE1117359.1 hypothetical protein [Methanosphaera sp.]MEE3418818.1 hypothetical protein [Methanosphaera sp.]